LLGDKTKNAIFASIIFGTVSRQEPVECTVARSVSECTEDGRTSKPFN
jgi:hypothetical protein